MRLIVGLGNPGPRYQNTRHNAGFLVLDELARRHGVTLRASKQAEEGRLGGATLLKPLTFMNLSGSAVQAQVTKQRLAPDEILVIHDDLDLPLGRLRLKPGGGGAGGQRGVADISARLGPGFARLKLGIGRPPTGWKVENWVLSRFREDEQRLLATVVQHAADAVEMALETGFMAAMNRYNGLELPSPES